MLTKPERDALIEARVAHYIAKGRDQQSALDIARLEVKLSTSMQQEETARESTALERLVESDVGTFVVIAAIAFILALVALGFIPSTVAP